MSATAIDDNTLFVLLALCQNNKVTIPNLITLYDYNTNYDYTVIKPNNKQIRHIDLANAGIDYITENFGVVKSENEKQIILHLENTEHLKEYLNKYLETFPHDKLIYYDETKHLDLLYSFIKNEAPEILEIDSKQELAFEGKYFTYKYLPEKNKEKYKMIEFLALLVKRGFLQADNNTYEFWNEAGKPLKTIRVKFITKLKMQELFLKYYQQEKQSIIIKKLENNEPICQSAHWIIYEKDVIYIPEPSEPQYKIVGSLTKRYKNLLIFCIKKGNNRYITPDDYNCVYAETAKKYFSELHADIKRHFGQKVKVLYWTETKKKWKISV